MKTFLGVNKSVNTEIGKLDLEIMVESKSGKLNPQTGKIIRISELNRAINDLMLEKSINTMKPLRGFKYLPQTIEVFASRLWEHIEQNLNFEARMARIKVANEQGFVIYDGREEERPMMPMPQPKPQRKYKRKK